ncbi:hypothetical protein TSUD_344050 [Trifolium subterraneum]|nr:hypothetical protein TSUD_344050 [Trifolium subterraneum]
MAESSNSTFLQPSVPKFDGYYDHWAMLTENLIRSKEFWPLIETGVTVAPPNATAEQVRIANESKLKDLKVKNFLFQAIDRTIMETILIRETSKDIWDAMKQKYQGSTKVKRAQLQALRREFEVLEMKDDDSVNEYFAKTLAIANKMTLHGERVEHVTVVEKILRSMPAKFNYVVCSIEQSHDVTSMTIDELQSTLLVQEQRMKNQRIGGEEQALKVSNGGRGYNPRGRGRGSNRGRGRGRSNFNKELVECYKCHKLGHYQHECPDWNDANYAEFVNEEETLLMASTDHGNAIREKTWYLDSGCSNHMIGNKDWLFDFDPSFKDSVRLGNDARMSVMGKGNVKLFINGKIHVISNVYFIPGLNTNLLSVGQLQQRNVTIIFKEDSCKGYHEEKGLIFSTQMIANRMFILTAQVIVPMCLQVSKQEQTKLWHDRYGHLSIKGLKLLTKLNMVNGLPEIGDMEEKCISCLTGKQNRKAIPKQAKWRATSKLQLIHSDICGPINPSSNGEKSLRTDRGGEYTSSAFNDFCSTHGIKRQLTTAYTPQQNGVSERKNRTLLNMIRSMLNSRSVPKRFWPEALKWATYIMNRSPTVSVKNITPEEAWSDTKPTVTHFRVFGCIAYVHVPDNNRRKLDNKSIVCVNLGISDESKAYKLYNPASKKIVISRDVVFDEFKAWDWENKQKKNNNEVHNEILTEEMAEDTTPNGQNEDITDENISSESDSTEAEEDQIVEDSEDDDNQLGPRIRKVPSHLRDYVLGEEAEEEQTQNLAFYSDNGDPETYDEACKNQVWNDAMDSEIKAIETNGTWELTDLPKGSKAIGVKWIFKTKYKENGQIDKHKARLVAKGYSQKYGIDYVEVFAPVARWETIRTVLAWTASKGWIVYQLDVKSASLHGELAEDIYVEQPLGYHKREGNKVYKLKKALYGLKQAPRAWYSKIEAYFASEGFEKSPVEHTLFVKQQNDQSILIVSVYVDDLIITGNNQTQINAFKQSMMKQFAMSDLGKMKYFLGVEVVQTNAVKRIIRYVKGTTGFGILYKRSSENLQLKGWTDSDYAGDLDDRRSTSGYVFKLGNGAISWSSKKQPIVTLSTTEAEFIAAASCSCQCIWLKNVLKHLKIEQDNTTVLHCDNSSSIKLSKNPILHGRCKHIDVRFHFLRDLTKDGIIELVHCKSQEQIADIMTKALKLETFCNLRSELGMIDLECLN